jgi:hypothetical protein
VGHYWLESLIGDSGASGGKSMGIEPFSWLDSGSIGVVAGSEVCVGVSTTGSLDVFWSSFIKYILVEGVDEVGTFLAVN